MAKCTIKTMTVREMRKHFDISRRIKDTEFAFVVWFPDGSTADSGYGYSTRAEAREEAEYSRDHGDAKEAGC